MCSKCATNAKIASENLDIKDLQISKFGASRHSRLDDSVNSYCLEIEDDLVSSSQEV